MADKKKVVNKYIGMSAEELQKQKAIAEQFIAMYERDIKRIQAECKQKIKENQAEIRAYKQNLEFIDEASKHTTSIQYMTIIEVNRTVKSEYVVVGIPKRYYAASDWKEKVYYTYNVLTCNAQDNRMARDCRFSSTLYSMSERQDMLKMLVADIQKYNVNRVILGEGVKLSKATLQKYCKDIVSLETNV